MNNLYNFIFKFKCLSAQRNNQKIRRLSTRCLFKSHASLLFITLFIWGLVEIAAQVACSSVCHSNRDHYLVLSRDWTVIDGPLCES